MVMERKTAGWRKFVQRPPWGKWKSDKRTLPLYAKRPVGAGAGRSWLGLLIADGR